MGTQRPLIVPWLLEQLDTQQFPGVSWLNPERTRFRIPWKHGSRQSTIPEDFQLFEAWAIASGRYNPSTDPRTPSEWKRNFRSALNRKPDIKVTDDNSTDSEDPHKVFEIQRSAVPNAHAPIEAGDLQESLEVCAGSAPCQGGSLEDVLKTLNLSGPEQGAENPVYNIGPSGLDPGLSTVPMIPLEPTFGANEFVDNAASCVGLPPSGFEQAQPTAPIPLLDQIIQTSAFGREFEVRAYYRGQLVFHNTFSNVQGLCFVSPGSFVAYPDLATVVLPDTSNLNDQWQVVYTNRLLRGVDPGVLLKVEGLSLCGSRLGSCHVYWSQSEMPTAGTRCGGLPKEQFSSLYSQQQFVQELIGFLEGRNGSPDYTLWLCFGEEWPDPHRPWKKKLIMVQIIPKAFEILHELCKARGASSLNGVEPDLRISDSSQDSLPLLEQLRSWGERMDVECDS